MVDFPMMKEFCVLKPEHVLMEQKFKDYNNNFKDAPWNKSWTLLRTRLLDFCVSIHVPPTPPPNPIMATLGIVLAKRLTQGYHSAQVCKAHSIQEGHGQLKKHNVEQFRRFKQVGKSNAVDVSRAVERKKLFTAEPSYTM